MWSIALRWLPRRLLTSLRSPMMWSMARRCSSRLRRRSSSSLTCSWRPVGDSSRSSSTAASGRRSLTRGHSVPSGLLPLGRPPLQLFPQAFQLPFEGDHLELAADDHLLELLEVQDLLLQLGLGLLEVADHLLVGAHVAEDADGADDLAVIAEGGGVEGGGDDLAAGAAGVEAGVPGYAARDDLTEGGAQLPGLLGADEAGERLLDQLVRAEAEQGEDGVVGLEDLALEVGDDEGVGGVLDEALGVGAGLVELAHVAEDADGADDLAVGVAEGGGIEGGGDALAAGAAGVEAGVAGDAARDDLAEGGGELTGLLGADEARERLLQHLVGAEAEELGDGVVGLEDLALEVGDEHGVGGVLDEALGVGAGLVELAHVAQDTDGADDLAVGIAEGGGVEGGGDDLAAGAAGVEAGVAGDAALDDLAEGGGELTGLLGADEARERLLQHLVLAEAEELGDGVVGLEDLALEVGDEHGVGRVGDDGIGIERAVPFAAAVPTDDGRLGVEARSFGHWPRLLPPPGGTVPTVYACRVAGVHSPCQTIPCVRHVLANDLQWLRISCERT